MIKSFRAMRGVKLMHMKRTRLHETINMPSPQFVTIPLSQHIGAPCEAIVSPGEYVFLGQKIGDSKAFISSPVHSSVSGTVEGFVDILTPANEKVKCLRIKSDGLSKTDPNLEPPQIDSKEDFVSAIRESGIVGLGGAGFPTHVKLAYKDIEKIKTLYINLAECEPYITTDNREVLENVNGVINGIKLILKYTGIPQAVVVVENNKPIGTKILALHLSEIPNIKLKVIGNKYPKGAEKILIYEAGGPVISRGMLPADCGALVLNVSTVSAIESYIRTGIPLISRRITLDGDIISSPMNIKVDIGTPIIELLKYANVDENNLKMLITGGAMMGSCIIDLDYPITKTANALLCFTSFYDRDKTPCINCGKCKDVCPMRLMPVLIEKSYDKRDETSLLKLNLDLCMNCGCCSYICPAKRDLSHKIQLAKLFLKGQEAK